MTSTPSRAALLITVLLAPVALAQDQSAGAPAADNTPSADSSKVLEQVLVYGEKVERSYLDTFGSVGIVTADDLEAHDVGDTQGVYLRMANVRAFTEGTGTNSIAIRGINADGVQPANSAALISVIIDGVTQSAEGLKRGSRGVWDVEQIEVHRGPQSTTHGRNALAGAVVIKSKDPTYEPEYALRAIYGELDRREIAAALSGPIIGNELAYRLSGEYRERTDDVEFEDRENEFFADDEFHNVRAKLLWEPATLEDLSILLTYNDVFDSPSSTPVTGPDFFDRVFNGSSVFAESREMDLQNYAADISYDLGGGMTLRSISAYNDSDLEIGSVPSSDRYFREDTRNDSDFTQELLLELNEERAGWTGIAGIFYADFDGTTDSFIESFGLVIQDGTFERRTETWALYGDFRWQASSRLSFTLGGRYQDDTISTQSDVTSAISGPSLVDQETSDDVFLPKLAVAYDLHDNQTLAFTAGRGYRQGFTETLVSDRSQVNEVDPEFVWTYELAYRVSAVDNRLTLGANVFYNDYSDQQVTVSNPDVPILTNTFNAGDSSSYGAEVEMRYLFGNGLSIYAALGLIETELGDFPDPICDRGNCEGNEFTDAPPLTASLGGEYFHSNGFFASLAASYTDAFFQEIDNGANTEVDSNVLVNGMIGWQFKRFRVSAYVNNLFDEEYFTGRRSDTEAWVGDPRNAGLEVSASF
ncbi:MAG: TonB-dependent receptor [Pseudomonadota bacterium]